MDKKSLYQWGIRHEIESLVCPECKKSSPIDKWKETEVGCPDCDGHDAIECPSCNERFDNVWDTDDIKKANIKPLH